MVNKTHNIKNKTPHQTSSIKSDTQINLNTWRRPTITRFELKKTMLSTGSGADISVMML